MTEPQYHMPALPGFAVFTLHGEGALRADGLYVRPGVDHRGQFMWRAGPMALPRAVMLELRSPGLDIRGAIAQVQEACPPASWCPAWKLPWPTDVQHAQDGGLALDAEHPDDLADHDPVLLAEDYLFGWEPAVTVPRWWPGSEERPHD